MSSVLVTKADGSTEEFEDTIGHQIGNGAVQIMKGNGEQVIFNNFIQVDVTLNDEEKEAFAKSVANVEDKIMKRIEAKEASDKLAEVPQASTSQAVN